MLWYLPSVDSVCAFGDSTPPLAVARRLLLPSLLRWVVGALRHLPYLHTRLSRVPTVGRIVLHAPTLPSSSLANDRLRRHMSHRSPDDFLSRDDILADGFAEMASVIRVNNMDHHPSLGVALSSDRLWLRLVRVTAELQLF